MPYVEHHTRNRLALYHPHMMHPGELNFAITSLLIDYLKTNGRSYRTMHDIVGALESAKAEFQRRVINPYEQNKLEENGDAYP
jgi:hypothetical protein